MSTIPLILVCDDQAMVHEALGVYLQNEGYQMVSAYDGAEALKLVEEKKPDLIILDLMMPQISGIEVCREVRKSSNVPILMLTAKGEEIDRILGLELGADDYIVKPFSPREVVARIKAVLRRVNESAEEDTTRVLRFDGLTINLANYEVKINDKQVPFTPKGVEILYLLASHPGQVFDREQILSRVWGYDYFGDTRAVDTQIKRIRQKFPEDAKGFGIRTISGVGYKFEVEQ